MQDKVHAKNFELISFIGSLEIDFHVKIGQETGGELIAKIEQLCQVVHHGETFVLDLAELGSRELKQAGLFFLVSFFQRLPCLSALFAGLEATELAETQCVKVRSAALEVDLLAACAFKDHVFVENSQVMLATGTPPTFNNRGERKRKDVKSAANELKFGGLC